MRKALAAIVLAIIAGFFISLAGHVYLKTSTTTHAALGGIANSSNFVRAENYNAPFTSKKIISCGQLVDCPSQIIDKQHFVINWALFSLVGAALFLLLLKLTS